MGEGANFVHLVTATAQLLEVFARPASAGGGLAQRRPTG